MSYAEATNIADPRVPQVRSVEANGYRITIGEARGARYKMEDRSTVSEFKGGVLFGVFDGHGSCDGHVVPSGLANGLREAFEQGLGKTSNKALGRLRTRLGFGNRVSNAFVKAYEILDKKTSTPYCGSTAVTAYLTKKCVWVACAGDSAAFGLSGRVFRRLSTEHRLTNPSERRRILEHNADFLDKCYWGDGTSFLMPTRGFGDSQLKSFGLMSAPDIDCMDSPDKVLLCTDGLTDGLRDARIGAVLKELSATVAVQELVSITARRKRADNVTVVLAEKM